MRPHPRIVVVSMALMLMTACSGEGRHVAALEAAGGQVTREGGAEGPRALFEG